MSSDREAALTALENALPLDTPDSVVVETLRNLEANGWSLAAQPSPDGLLRDALEQAAERAHMLARHDLTNRMARGFRECPHDQCPKWADLAASPSGDRPSEPCWKCGGSGTVAGIGADPLPSGEPGEPYQVQEQCPDCGGNGYIPQSEPSEPGSLRAAAEWLVNIHGDDVTLKGTALGEDIAALRAALSTEGVTR